MTAAVALALGAFLGWSIGILHGIDLGARWRRFDRLELPRARARRTR